MSESEPVSKYAYLATPDPEWAALFAKIPYREPASDVRVARERVEKFFVGTSREHFRPLLPPDSQYHVADHQVPTRSGHTLVRTVTPASPQGEERTFPCLAWIHGGGFSAGSIEFDDFRLRVISVELQISIVNIEYRLAPEDPYPAALNDCYDALKWAAENPTIFGASLSKGFFLGGTSAGANYVANAVHRARDDPFFEGRRLTGQILQFPPIIHPDGYPEKYKEDLRSIFMEEYKKMTILTRPMMYSMYRYLGAAPDDPDAFPLLKPSHAGIPSTFFQIAGLDPLRDEGLLYERLLREEGVKTLLKTYPGVPHGFHLPFPNLTASAKFEKELKVGIKWLIDGAS